MTSWKEITALMQAAKTELLASKLRTDPEAGWQDDADFLGQVWTAYTDDEVWEASPSLKKALVAYCQYRADDILGSFDEILSSVDGRNKIVLFDLDEFDEACWEQWKK